MQGMMRLYDSEDRVLAEGAVEINAPQRAHDGEIRLHVAPSKLHDTGYTGIAQKWRLFDVEGRLLHEGTCGVWTAGRYDLYLTTTTFVCGWDTVVEVPGFAVTVGF